MWEPQILYSKFVLKQPTLLTGLNAIRGLRNYPCSRVAVVHGESLSTELKDIIRKSIVPFDLKFILKSWKGEPTLYEIGSTIKDLESFKPDLIIAIGGGSVIDGTKVARLYYEFPFFDITNTRFTNLEWKTRFVAIPTTIGSGAEISSAAVLIDTKEQRKEMIVSHSLLPDIIVFDPSYVKDTPMRIILLSALDAVAHIVEGYVSVLDNNLIDFYAEKGLQNVRQTLSDDTELTLSDFSALQFAGYLGGIVQNHCLVGAAHAIAHQLGSHGFSHTEAVALILPDVIKANSSNSDEVEKKYEKLCLGSGFNDINDLVIFIETIAQKAGLSEKKTKLQNLLSCLQKEPSFINNIQNDKGGKGNPITLSSDFIEQILNNLLS